MKKIFIFCFSIICVFPAFGYITENVVNGCGNISNKMDAVFEIPEYTCNAGYYLPADSDTCVACPSGYTCNGGIFLFNSDVAQGIRPNINGLITQNVGFGCGVVSNNVDAVFEIVSSTCASGQYLPKNTTTCVACPNGYTCAGGTFTFDANIDQGIVGNTITVIWNGATAEDVAANNAGTITYGGDIRTPVRPDPSQIPAGKRFVGWTFRKTND